MEIEKDWKVISATASQRSGGLHVTVQNHSDAGRICYWHIDDLTNERYDWSECSFAEGGQERYGRLAQRARDVAAVRAV